MRVFMYGEMSVEASGAWCYAETLREMGHTVAEHSQLDGLEGYERSLMLRAYRKLTGRTLPWHGARHARRLTKHVAREHPELVIILKGLNVSRENVLEMRRTGAFVVLISHDDFFSLNRSNWSPMQHRALAAYDYVFTTRTVNVEEVRSYNPNVEFFPFAYYPKIHRKVLPPQGLRSQWDNDVVFVGTWERERAALLEELVKRVPAKYAIWGTQWERLSQNSPLRAYVRSGPIVGDEMAMALGGSKIALAFLRKENRDDYTQRTFEIPACGGVLLAERTSRQLEYYREGIEAEFFDPNDALELCEKVRRLLADPQRRESIRQAGTKALAGQCHTYRDRLERLLELYAERREALLRP